MKVALVHDYLNQLGGAERVLEVLCEMFPEAPIFTLFYDEAGTRGRFRGRKIRRAFPAVLPTRFFFWSYPFLIRRFDFSGFDLVISSSWSYGKGVGVPDGIAHICYCYSPTRYLWEDVANYVTGWLGSAVALGVAEILFRQVRQWDLAAAQRPTTLIAISTYIASRIRDVYAREPDAVIHPPIDLSKFQYIDILKSSRSYFLMVGRLLPYKKFDLGITACNELGLPLKIVGEGRDRKRLERIAGPTVAFLGWVPDQELPALYAGARALIFPQVEDFGLVAVEAIACGTPVIAYRSGGALDIVEEGVNGIFFDEQTPDALMSAIGLFQCKKFNPQKIADTAQRFDRAIFKQSLFHMVERMRKANLAKEQSLS